MIIVGIVISALSLFLAGILFAILLEGNSTPGGDL